MFACIAFYHGPKPWQPPDLDEIERFVSIYGEKFVSRAEVEKEHNDLVSQCNGQFVDFPVEFRFALQEGLFDNPAHEVSFFYYSVAHLHFF
jgi:hypothetical protein